MKRAETRPCLLHFVDTLGIGGLERNLELLVRHTGDRFEHHVCCLRERGALATTFEGHGVEVIEAAVAGNRPTVAIRQLTAIIRKIRPQLVHARNWVSIEAVPAARLAGVGAVVFSEHGCRTLPRVRRREWARWLLSPLVDAFIAPSQAVQQFLTAMVGIPVWKTQLIANGVDAERFRPRHDRMELRAALGLAAEDRIVLAVGRLQPVKQYALLVEVFAALAAADPRRRLVFVGDGPERTALEQRIATLGLTEVVQIAGMRDDVEKWLACADVFAHPSLSEGASNAILQSLACAVPVVANDLAANAEMITSGKHGTLIADGDERAWVNVLDQYLSDAPRCQREGDAARRQALELFPLERTIEAYASLYRRLCDGGR